MTLTEAQKKKIKEEKKYRAKIRKRPRKKKKGLGCLGWGIILFAVLPVLAIIISSVIYIFGQAQKRTQEEKYESTENAIPVTLVFNTKTFTEKTVLELLQILGKPSSEDKPSVWYGKTHTFPQYGHLLWEKNEIEFYIEYLDENAPPQALEFQFEGVKLSFSSNDFNKAFQLIGLDLTKSQFRNTSPLGFTRYDARNLAGFELIGVQSTMDDKMHIKSILFIQSCEPESSLCK